MYRNRVARFYGGLFICLAVAFAGGALAQTEPNAQANKGTVGIIAGAVDGTYIRIASDLSAVLDHGDDLRVLALLGKGSIQNIDDILHLKGVDIGIVQSDALAYAKKNNLFPNVEQRLRYIAKLYNEELHILARPDVGSIGDLAGKKVNFDGAGSGTYMTATLAFEALGIEVEPTTYDQSLALEKLRTGEISALAYVAGKPTRLFRDIGPSEGLHFLEVPATPELLETYLPSRLTREDYPSLIGEGEGVQTIGVSAVMAVYNWEANNPNHQDRYRKVVAFIDDFFGRFDEFLKPPRHAKWHEVNLAAQLPGWERFGHAGEWLEKSYKKPEPAVLQEKFESFALERGKSTEEAEALFQEFLEWRNAQGGASKAPLW